MTCLPHILFSWLITISRDGSDALGKEGRDLGDIVVKLKNVAIGVGKCLGMSIDNYLLFI